MIYDVEVTLRREFLDTETMLGSTNGIVMLLKSQLVTILTERGKCGEAEELQRQLWSDAKQTYGEVT
jgi:hypothetical protein